MTAKESSAPGDARSDGATDLAIGVLLVVGAACWVGLVAGQLGCFALAPVVVAGAVAALVAGVGLRERSTPAAGAGSAGATARWRAADGPLIFVLALLLYAPGYDTTLYGSDSTVYLGSGVHLARTGALAIDDPLLLKLPPALQTTIFLPAGSVDLPGAPRMRSLGGLAYRDLRPPVYSVFSQLPSVWLAIGYALGGLRAAILVNPLLAAAAIMVFYLLVRRLSGTPVALLAAGLAAPALPQLLFARMPTAEIGGQFFLWAGLLAHSRWHETRKVIPALAAGIGFGLAGISRPEYVAFLPFAGVLLWLSGAGLEAWLPAATGVVAGALFAHAVSLVQVVPSHYWGAINEALFASGLTGGQPAHAPALVLAAALAWVGARVAARYEPGGGGRVWRAFLALGLVLWGLGYVLMPRSPAAGSAIPWLHYYTGWPALLLALPGVPMLARRWWQVPSGRLAILLAGVAASHLFIDLHAGPFAVWAGRRLLPAVIPILCAGVATAAWTLARWWRPVALLLAAVAVAGNVWNSRDLFGRPYFQGMSAAAAEIAALFPADAVVFVDGGLLPTLLDIPLWLVHEREAVLIPGPPGAMAGVLAPVLFVLPDVPVYLLRQAALPDPSSPLMTFDPAGEVSSRVMPPGMETRSGVPTFLLLRVRAYRVRLVPHG